MRRDAGSSSIAVAITVFASLCVVVLFLAIGGAYVVGFHAGNDAIHAAEVAQEGKSKALCDALKEMAETPAANKLHPVFENVYASSGCVKITGAATP